MTVQLNVLGTELEECGLDPITGFLRDGNCSTGPQDLGSHTVCAIVDEAFLEYSRSAGNDLVTPMPEYGFPGLKPGDRWCLCASRWKQAYEAGCAPPVYLRATHERALELIELDVLKQYARDLS
ncbi:MAG: DUF2237 domain-containing protein [Gammaproteobacteria bacterium]|nr:DUF2237 domain-containing protein [Gammaproteobacteria bacterium]